MAHLDSFGGAVGPMRELLAQHFWIWFDQNQDTVILTRRIVVFSIAIRVRDCRVLFEMLVGPRKPSVIA